MLTEFVIVVGAMIASVAIGALIVVDMPSRPTKLEPEARSFGFEATDAGID